MKKKKVAVFTLILFSFLTMLIAAYPESWVEIIPIEGLEGDSISRTFSLLNSFLLAILGIYLGRSVFISPTSKNVEYGSNSIEAGIELEENRYTDPASKVLILSNFASFTNEKKLITTIEKVSILANLRPEITKSLREVERVIKDERVEVVIADDDFYPELMRIMKENDISILTLKKSNNTNIPRTRKGTLRVELIDENLSEKDQFDLASRLCELSHLDVTRSPGFHGNWNGTYGVVAITQSENSLVKGHYYYGKGEFEGHCEVDIINKRLILRYKWSQHKNASGTGSVSFGNGVFIIPAGYDYFIGYWFDKGSAKTGQPWSASRLASVIGSQVRTENGVFGTNFGLDIHERRLIIEE